MLISIGLYTLAAVEEKLEVIARYAATVRSAICIAVTCFVFYSPWDPDTVSEQVSEYDQYSADAVSRLVHSLYRMIP